MSMTRKEFEKLVREGFVQLPAKFRKKIKNVGFLVEDEPSTEVRKEMRLDRSDTLLGFYRGVPRTARGEGYGIGPTLPDAIIIYQKPTEEAAYEIMQSDSSSSGQEGQEGGGAKEEFEDFKSAVRRVVADTVWHEVAHHFGLSEKEVARREAIGRRTE